MAGIRALLIICCILLSTLGYAQNETRSEIGIRAGYGFRNEVLPEQKIYKPVIILPYFNYYLSKRGEQKKGRFSIYVEPQFTPVILDYKHSSRYVFEYELGLNLGAVFNYRINTFMPYIGAGSGPNFISVHTRKQADGFLFSDNFFTGVKKEFKGKYLADLHFRVRHISNAGLEKPNEGIDNVFVGAGISTLIGK